ncbi:MAG: tRNA pseudouridine(13) synthase TruD [Euryarchaeota archaeon]|nr:tRNA pseudouridine(13) synthase TruD [Euryarchaeota archaeon]
MKESELGLEVFLTEGIPGIGGKLRKTPEDFQVDEISILPPADPEGKFVIANVWHRNWEANRLVRRLGSNLRIGRAKIGFAGTKDGRSVSTQLMSFNAPIEAVQSLAIPDVEILDAYRARRMISIGDLVGNRFKIGVADIDAGVDAKAICDSVKAKLDSIGGFPNFFGIQRFGSVRPITHLIGKDLIRGDFEGAVMRYVANPMDEEGSEANDARRALQETRDFERAFREFPMKLSFERTMIGHIKDNPTDYLGALRLLPYNLLMMFVHAYQSHLFNRILSERIRKGMSLREPEVGDLVLPLSKTNVPDHDNSILVTVDNLEKATRNAREGKAFVSGLLYGTESVFADGRMGEIERKIVEAEEISKLDFQIVGLREASSKGSRREILSSYKDLAIIVGEGEATFQFTLTKGCYATTLMREFMKAEISQY